MSLYNKYKGLFNNYEKGIITEEELLLKIFVSEGKMSMEEFDSWIVNLKKGE